MEKAVVFSLSYEIGYRMERRERKEKKMNVYSFRFVIGMNEWEKSAKSTAVEL